MHTVFQYDDRLGIRIPRLLDEWETFSAVEQSQMLRVWEEIRGRIPERIFSLEREIRELQDKLNREDSFPESCRLNSRISDLASIINDLNIWFRTHQDMGSGKPHG